MFKSVPTAPSDEIFDLLSLYKLDRNPNKINLTIGVFQNDLGETPILKSVVETEAKLLSTEKSKAYLGIDGLERFNQLTRELVLGAKHPTIEDGRALTLQTPGGTGALRIAGDFIARHTRDRTIWCTDPTWPNHVPIFEAAGARVGQLDYLNADKTGIDFETYLLQLARVPEGNAVLLHVCCHNPTGFDPNRDQWEQILQVVADRNLLPVFDLAYQGFHLSLEKDVWVIQRAIELGCTLLICNSFSKSMSLYAERIGALTVVAETSQIAPAVFSQLKAYARAMYSNPPQHGAKIVANILGDPQLRAHWIDELTAMRIRVTAMRALLADRLRDVLPDHDFSYLRSQNGMFSYSGLTPKQVEQLISQHSVYLLRSSRINVAGINPENVVRLCESIAHVVGTTVAT
ncbi:MAG TPA: amino acid aminotransferase [Pirellulaceae bacterium]|nr:amino acid aminotransferase [Pirellulaceae bacterium]HMO92957.1 amino acid aminotransferase [Pirellulaceae bacterium]HMP68478.1 amino acid aminotransferase [Pirellulaceae bacterium]